MTRTIGLLGPAGAGKSSVAEYLERCYGAKRYSLAGPLKEIAMRTLDLTHDQCWGTQAQKETVDPRYGFSPRWFLQRLGTEGCRAVLGDKIWTQTCLTAISRDRVDFAVIEDVRFMNEAEAILFDTSYGRTGQVWRLVPPAQTDSIDTGTHASESEWRRAPFSREIVPNARGLKELFGLVDDACASLGIRQVSQ